MERPATASPNTPSTGPKVIEMSARIADRICFAVGADPERIRESVLRARAAAEGAGRDPASLRFGAFVNCVVHPDRDVAREAVVMPHSTSDRLMVRTSTSSGSMPVS